MKLLLDQGLPLSAAALLRDAGINTIHVGEIGMSEAEDADIIQTLELLKLLLMDLPVRHSKQMMLLHQVTLKRWKRLKGDRNWKCVWQNVKQRLPKN